MAVFTAVFIPTGHSLSAGLQCVIVCAAIDRLATLQAGLKSTSGVSQQNVSILTHRADTVYLEVSELAQSGLVFLMACDLPSAA